MNPILEKWLAERQAKEKESREAFLIKQGLVDSSKTITVFKDVQGNILSEDEAKKRKEEGLRVEEHVTYDALDLTDEEYNLVLTYAKPQTLNGELTDHELLKKISHHTGIVSIALIVFIILSVIVGIIMGIS
ncbi:MAG: hypothetical protein IKW99_03735 [Bacteroidales bacterium]|nr:hypothetical protein [Bacteroidales bacterium]